MKIYLAGAMNYYRNNNYDENAIKWRLDITRELRRLDTRYTVFDPTLSSEEYKHDIITQNSYYLDKCDLIVVNLKDIDKSFGTIYEVITGNKLNKPIIAFGSHRWEQHPHLSKIISYHSPKMSDIIEFIGNVYDQ